MRDHDHVSEESLLRPKAARIDDPVSAELGRAAAEGRSDVMDRTSMLGLQRAVGNSGVSAMLDEERSPVHDVVASGGRPLDEKTRTDMESRLGQDFGDVRIHDDGAAHESASSVNAHAYTVGSNIVFQRNTYDPGSDAGRLMLAHELTHVVQQRSGPVEGTSMPGGIKVSDPSDRFEREASSNAERVMAAPPSAPTPSPTAAPAVQRTAEDVDLPPVQREEAPEEEKEEEAVQGAFVQRQEEEETEEE
jgi:hypothetical protein